MIRIYSKPSCPACYQTARQFDKFGMEYVEVDLTEKPELIEEFAELGMRAAPVVFANGKYWCGFNPSNINSLADA